MDTEKSRKFYLERYDKAIEQYGENSLTAKICKKKLELLDAMTDQRDNAKDTSEGEHHTEGKTGEDKTDTKSDIETDEFS